DIDLLPRLFHRDHRAGQRAQRSALCGCQHQFMVHDARHRRHHDREFGLEEIEKSAVWPHGFARLREWRDDFSDQPREAAEELRLPWRIWSASVTIRSTISAAGGMSWIRPTPSPAKTPAMSKFPAALAAAYSAATAPMFCS